MNFHDGKYNTTKDKEKIAKAWVRFLKGGLKKPQFTSALYKHLSLYFGFIAHCNIHGFYEERFEEWEGRLQTFHQIKFAPSYMFNDGNTSGNGDLNMYIQEKANEFYDEIAERANQDRITELRTTIQKSQTELSKLGV